MKSLGRWTLLKKIDVGFFFRILGVTRSSGPWEEGADLGELERNIERDRIGVVSYRTPSGFDPTGPYAIEGESSLTPDHFASWTKSLGRWTLLK